MIHRSTIETCVAAPVPRLDHPSARTSPTQDSPPDGTTKKYGISSDDLAGDNSFTRQVDQASVGPSLEEKQWQKVLVLVRLYLLSTYVSSPPASLEETTLGFGGGLPSRCHSGFATTPYEEITRYLTVVE